MKVTACDSMEVWIQVCVYVWYGGMCEGACVRCVMCEGVCECRHLLSPIKGMLKHLFPDVIVDSFLIGIVGIFWL